MAKRLKIVDRDALREWEEFRKGLINAATIDDTETIPEKRARIVKLEANPEEWFKYYFPNYYSSEPAPFHKRSTKKLLANKRYYLVRAWSRELAKSARSMMEVIYLALTKEVKNVLLVSNSLDNAARLLKPFQINFESNPRIINDYGTQQSPGRWEENEFVITAGCSFRALGAGQSPRGTRNEAARPDFILIDDIDTDQDVRNPDIIKKRWEWIEQALIPTVSISGNYRILFNGNIIGKYCCITQAIEKANDAEIVNIRDKNGKSSWPQRNSEEDVDDMLSNISTASAQKEYFNNPLSEGDTFTEMRWGKVPRLSTFPFLIVYADPAPSNSKNKSGSFKSAFLLGAKEGKYYVITGYLDHVTNDEFTQWFYSLKDFVGDKTQVYNYIENNTLQNPFYEQVFKPLFYEKSKTQGFIGITPDERKKPDKFSRIEGNLEPLNRDGRLILNETEKDNPHMKRLEEQFLLISPKLPAPADGPDCIEGGIYIINEKLTALLPDTIVIGSRRSGTKKF